MNLFSHYFRKEWAFAWKLVFILLFFLLLRIPAGLGWMSSSSGGVFQDYAPRVVYGMSGPILLSYAFIFIFQILGAESPVARESFVATRPVRYGQLGLAKVTALLAFFVGPPLVAEAIYLIANGLSATAVFWGLLQVGLFLTVGILVAAAVFWLLRTKKEKVIGFTALAIVYIATLALGELLGRYYRTGEIFLGFQVPFEDRFSLLRIFFALVVGAVGAWVLLACYWKRGTTRFGVRLTVMVFLAFALMMGLWFLPMGGASQKQKAESVEMVAKLSGNHFIDGERFYELNVAPLPKQLFGGEQKFFSVNSLSIEEGTQAVLPPRPLSSLLERNLHSSGSEFLDSAAFRAEFEEEPVCFMDFHGGGNNRGGRVLVWGDMIASEAPRIEVELSQYQVNWKKVAELPFKEGAQWKGWSFGGLRRSVRSYGSPVIQLSERRRRNWLRGEASFPVIDAVRVVLVDQKRNLAFPIEDLNLTQTISDLSVMQWRGFKAMLNEDTLFILGENLEDCRILIFEASAEKTGELTWSGQAEVAPDYGNGRALARDADTLSVPQFETWLKAHPVPPASASERELARYLVSLLEQTKHLNVPLPEGHPVALGLSGLVEGHFALFMRARDELAPDQHASSRILADALARGMTEEQFQENWRKMMGVPKVRTAARERGWFQPLGELLARGARGGDDEMLAEAILLPQKAGLTNEECVRLFNRKPRERLYKLLSQDPDLRKLLDQEIGLALPQSLRKFNPFGRAVDLELRLALTSGHPDAPGILQELLRRVYATRETEREFRMTYLNYFEAKSGQHGSAPWLDDFLKTNPEAWVFDRKEHKYRLPKTESEKESS